MTASRSAAVRRGVASRDFTGDASAMSNGQSEPINTTPEHFAKHIQSEIVKWGKVTREAGIKAE